MVKRNVSKKPHNTFQKQIDSIMENFNFEWVHKFMNWEGARYVWNDDCTKVIGYEPWYYAKRINSCQYDYYLPTLEELKESALKLLLEVSKSSNKYTYSATGIFRAEKFNDSLELMCVTESWCDD